MKKHMRTFQLISLMTLVLFSTCTLAISNPIILATNKTAHYQLVVDDEADIVVKNAANQLAYYLERISSAKFPVHTLSQINEKEGSFIYVGFNKNIPKVTIIKDSGLSVNETIVIKSLKDNSIILAGGSSRSTLYAVFQFLEDYLGCRWWTPEAETIPYIEQVVVPDIDVVYTPPFYYRSHFIYNTVSDAKFATIMRENGYYQPIDNEWGKRLEIAGWAHTFSRLLPVERYFDKNPEWYADPANGNRPSTHRSARPENSNTQLCLDNEELFKEFLQNTLLWIKEVKSHSPHISIFSISINDNQRFCQCDACMQTLQQEGSPSGSLIKFLNKLSGEVIKEYPDVKLHTLAYFAFLKPPKQIKPDPNLLIMVAPVEADYGKSIADPANQALKETMTTWGKTGNGSFYWGYNTNFSHLLMPHPSLHHIKKDLEFLVANNYKGVFLQDNRYTDGVGYFLDMQAWVIGKLLWNPALNQNQLIEEFMSNYYGPAGKYLVEYMQLITDSYMSVNSRMEAFNSDFSFLTSEVINKGNALFDKAITAVESNELYLKRVNKEKISLDYVNMTVFNPGLNIEKSNSSDIDAQIAVFFDQLEKYNVKKIDFSIDLTDSKKRLKASTERNNALSLMSGNLYIEESNFTLHRRGILTDIVEDKYASNGLVATIAKTGEWAIQSNLSGLALLLDKHQWKVRTHMKVELEVPQRKVKNPGYIEVGIYSTSSKKVKVHNNFSILKLDKQKYVAVDLPFTDLKPDDLIFIAIKDNQNVKRLLVDKIELVKR